MDNQDKTPAVTLGQVVNDALKGQKGGFNKKPSAVLMNVNAQDVQDMQRGYEMRIARQRDAITRLQGLLVAQVERFEQWMRAEIETTAFIDESDMAPVLAVAGGGVIDDTELDELLKLLPADYDFYNEDDTARTIIAGYIKYCKEEIAHQKGKQAHLMKTYEEPMNALTHFLGTRERSAIISGANPVDIAIAYMTRLETERNQSMANAKAAVGAAKQAQKLQVVDADDTPPWLKDEAFTAPATVGATGVWSNEPPAEISETLDWDGASQLPRGEEKPGNSF